MKGSTGTVLFFPWPIGAGHTGRCIIVARILRRAGYRCEFVFDPTGGLVSAEGFAVSGAAPIYQVRRRMPSDGYIAVPNLDSVYASAGYYHRGRIAKQVENDRAIIRTVRPILICTHMQPTAVIAARIEGIPVVSVAEPDFLAVGPTSWMPWLETLPPHLVPFPASAPAFNAILSDFHLPPITEVSDLLSTELVLLATTPELEPVQPERDLQGVVHYVGPLIWDPATNDAFAEPDGREGDVRPRVYVTLGSGEVAAGGISRASVQAAESGDWSLLLAPGYLGASPGPSDASGAVRVCTFGGLRAALRWADAVVCHGGHSTILAALLAGKPIVVAPAMSENEANGRALVSQTGAGFLACHTDTDPLSGRLRTVRRYPDLAGQSPLGAEVLRRAVAELLVEPKYAEAAHELSINLQPWVDAAPERVLRFVTELLR